MNASLTSASKSNGRIAWPESPSLKQYFSLPYSIMYYMAMNPSTPEVYNKLIQTCKYFFERNPILVVSRRDERNICAEIECDRFRGKSCCIEYEINKIKSKFWLTRELRAEFDSNINFNSLLSKIFRCEIDKLEIWHKNILFDDFKYLASLAKSVDLVDLQMVNSDEKVVMLEKILESIQNIENFECTCSVVTNATVKNILNLKNLANLKSIFLYRIPQVIEVKDLSRFIEEFKHTKIFLHFVDNLIEEYKNQLDALVDIVIKSNVPNRVIEYYGQDEENLIEMQIRFEDYISFY
uniref:DUF38 domain-containing protein n=1 Tax=Panagrolaimus sp. ES5 TaxID=591445 RepID=A0AC34FBI5_9BILA